MNLPAVASRDEWLEARKELLAADAGLELSIGSADHGVSRRFGSRAGGRRNRDPRRGGLRDLLPFTDNFHVIERALTIGQQAGDRLGGVDRTTSTQANDHLSAKRSRGLQAAINVGYGGFALLAESADGQL